MLLRTDVLVGKGDPALLIDIDNAADINGRSKQGRQTSLIVVSKYNGRANDREVTLGLFTFIYQGLNFSKLPVARHDDFGSGKAIGFMFIPIYSLYWTFRFVHSLRGHLFEANRASRRLARNVERFLAGRS